MFIMLIIIIFPGTAIFVVESVSHWTRSTLRTTSGTDQKGECSREMPQESGQIYPLAAPKAGVRGIWNAPARKAGVRGILNAPSLATDADGFCSFYQSCSPAEQYLNSTNMNYISHQSSELRASPTEGNRGLFWNRTSGKLVLIFSGSSIQDHLFYH